MPGLGVFLAPCIRVELAAALAQGSIPVDSCRPPVGWVDGDVGSIQRLPGGSSYHTQSVTQGY